MRICSNIESGRRWPRSLWWSGLCRDLAQRTHLLVVVAVAAAGPAVVGMWNCYARLRDLSLVLLGRRTSEPMEFLKQLRETWTDAQRCLWVLALLVGLGTIATGAFRNTLLAAGYKATEVPAAAVLSYGAFFTVISLLVYVPLYLAWRSRVTDFIDRVYPLPADARPTEDWANGRARLLTLLGADITLGKNLAAAAGILAPLATSLLTVFIPKVV